MLVCFRFEPPDDEEDDEDEDEDEDEDDEDVDEGDGDISFAILSLPGSAKTAGNLHSHTGVVSSFFISLCNLTMTSLTSSTGRNSPSQRSTSSGWA